MKRKRINLRTSQKLILWLDGRGLEREKERVRLRRIVVYGNIGLLSLIMLSLLFPLTPGTSQAVTADSSNPITDSAKLKAETYVYSTLAISLSESVNLDVVPKAGGSFSTGGANLTVTTNNTTGYAVFLQTGDNTSTLKPANGMIDAEIKPVVGEMNEGNFQQNLDTWGYAIGQADASLSSMNYKALPSSSDPAVITTDQLAAKDSYTLGFAASVSPNLPAGKYYNSVLVSVVANPIAIHTLSGITYMQEMSPYVCDYSDEHETKQLIDTRDGKSYWVAKLKDGNCWMVQNLALDIALDNEGNAAALSESGTKVTLDESNSDMSGKWNSQSVYPPRETLDKTLGTEEEEMVQSWDLGEYVFSAPTTLQACSTQSRDDPLADCAESGFVNVAGWTPFSTESAVAIDETNQKYDAHYLVGNYYTFGVVNAGTGSTYISSICPRSWKMPEATKTANYKPTETNNYYQLFLAYGYPSAENYVLDTWNNPYVHQSQGPIGKLIGAPLYFVRAGHILSGSLSGSGVNFVYQAANNINEIYNTSTRTSGNSEFVFPYYPSYHVTGIPVRCMAR